MTTRRPARRPATKTTPTKKTVDQSAESTGTTTVVDTAPEQPTAPAPAAPAVDTEALVTAARAEADQLLAAARTEAESLVDKARRQSDDADAAARQAQAEAEELLAAATAQAERMRKLTDEQITAAEETVQRARTIADGDLAAAEQTLARRRQAAEKLQAEAELEAGRIVDAARTRAGQIRTEAEEDKNRAQTEADATAVHAAHLVEEAKERAADLIAAAEADAAARRDAAAQMREEAEKDSEQLRTQARDGVATAEEDAAQILDTARGQAREVVREAEEDADERRTEAQQTLQAAQEQAEDEVLKVRSLAEAKAAGVAAGAEAAAAERVADAEREAARLVAAAEEQVDTVRSAALSEQRAAQRQLADIREEVVRAQELIERQEQREDFVNTWGPRVALGATIVLTASGEFALAKLTGWPAEIAWALPVAIDVYVVQAFRRHRDVAAALILMVIANAAYHLAAAGLVGVDKADGNKPLWWLIVAVAAIAPWVMWRVHQITKQPGETAPGETGTATTARPVGTDRARAIGETDTVRSADLTAPGETVPHPRAAPATLPETDEGETRWALETAPGETGDPVSTTETTSHTSETRRSDRETNPSTGGTVALPLRSVETNRPVLARDAEIEGQVTSLLSLMYRRQGIDTVSVDEAKDILGVSRATAGRRLEIARSRYKNVS